MKAQKFILWDELRRNNAIAAINELPLDGKTTITISDTGTKSARQRGLNWLWNGDVAKSGAGGKHEDTPEGVHLLAKYRWCVPILIRDDPFFASLWDTWVKLYGKTPERMEWFIDNQVHTEKLTVSQTAEFLTNFQAYYATHGVALSDPQEKDLLDFKGAIE